MDSWTRLFPDKREKAACGGHSPYVSDDEESCPDQVVYNEDHLKNLFGLYNRTEKAPPEVHSQSQLLEADIGQQRETILPALPSEQERAVWDALKEADIYLKAPAQFTQHETDGHWRTRACETAVENEIPEGSSEGDASIANEKHLRTPYEEPFNDATENYVGPEDSWDHIARSDGTLDDIQCLDPSVSAAKLKNTTLSKRHKGLYKKKLRFNFRATNKASSVGDLIMGPAVENKKVSLAQQLQSLARSDGCHSSESNLPIGFKHTASRTGLSMSEQFCELAQGRSRMRRSEKAWKNSGHRKMTNAFQTVGQSTERGDKFTDCEERHQDCLQEENDVAVAGPLDANLPTKSMNEQFQKALLSAPGSIEDSNRHSKVKGFGFSARLQQVLEPERLDRIHFLKMLHIGYKFQDRANCLEVEIVTKSLEARLSACACKAVKSPKSWIVNETGENSHPMVMVIFNMQTNAYLELEIGHVVCIHPPWRELSRVGEYSKTILCTYFSEFSMTQ